jgi:plastocyanin
VLASHLAAARARARQRTRHRAKAHAAGDPGNTITDFKFSPGTTTIHLGDAITWTNNGPSPHTATANDGSFDTGTLAKGKSASHTFTQSGTFAYICSIHPFMHGTVVVLAAAKTPASTAASTTTPTAGSGTPAATPAKATASHGPTLPLTGLGVPELVSLGLALLAFGWLLRRSARASS